MRKPDWETRLQDYLGSVRGTPHELGVHDCLIFSANAVRAITGKDLARGHRRKYDSVETSRKYLRKLGFSSPEKMIDSLLEKKPAGFAQRGDVVLVRDEKKQRIPGICNGEVCLIVGDEGLLPVPMAHWIKAWSVE